MGLHTGLGIREGIQSFGFRLWNSIASRVVAVVAPYPEVPVSTADKNNANPRKSESKEMPVVVTRPNQEALVLSSITQQNAPRLFALLIGINTYNHPDVPKPNKDVPYFTDLRGAVTDATEFQKYLFEIGVPEDHVQFLRDSEATRNNIIDAFKNLATRPDIAKGDSIFIFYAGHGAQAYPPERMVGTKGCPDKIELIIPHDYNKDPETHQDKGIPDFTLAVLLNNIAQEKGGNITVVFDCCHSASALRGATITPRVPNPSQQDDDVIFRSGPELDYHLPDNLDREIWGGVRSVQTLPRLRHMGTNSYVFFSACASDEFAREKASRGCFTDALLKFLKQHGPSAMPCTEITKRLPKLDGQSPQCEGLHRHNKSIFHDFSPRYKQCFFEVVDQKELNAAGLTLMAGDINGFVEDDELTVYRSKSEEDSKTPLGTVKIVKALVPISVLAFTSARFTLPNKSAYAQLTKPAVNKERHNFVLHIDPSDKDLTSRVLGLEIRNTVIVPNSKQAHISLSIHNDQLRFEVVDRDLIDLGVKLEPRLAPNEDQGLKHILTGLAHFYHHLKRSSSSPLRTDNIDIAFFPLSDTLVDQPRFVQAEGSDNLCKNSSIHVKVEEDGIYGMEVTNNTDEGRKFFPILFYFDNSEFTITTSYRSAFGPNPECPWPDVGKSITFGYGSGPGATMAPFSFFLGDGVDVDAGFFKLILSTTPPNLQHMVQETSPFELSRGMQHVKVIQPPVDEKWGSITIPVIQRRL